MREGIPPKVEINNQKSPALQRGDYYPVDSGDSEVLAFLRSSDGENLLVIINLVEEAREVALTLKEGPLAGSYQASLLSGGEAQLPDLVANDKGGFEAYQTVAVIPGGSVVIIELGAVK